MNSSETETREEVENLAIKDLTAEQVKELLPEWNVTSPEGTGTLNLAIRYGEKEWQISIDRALGLVRLSSDSDDDIKTPRSEENRLEQVILNRRNGYLRLQRDSSRYWEISRGGEHHRFSFPDSVKGDLSLVPQTKP